MEVYIHNVGMIMLIQWFPMCFNVGGLGWVSTYGLGKHVYFTTYPTCQILHVHEPNYFQQI